MRSTFVDNRRAVIDGAVILVGCIVLYFLIRNLNLYERMTSFVATHEAAQFDEVVVVLLVAFVGLLVFGARRLRDQRREIVMRQNAEDRASYMAMADMLTGLPNRRRFASDFDSVLSDLKGSGRQYAFMMIDLDRFKPVNDVFGHAVGDRVLVAFAKRASAVIPSNATFARFGGDEFALLLGPLADRDDPSRLARRLLSIFERPFEVDEIQVTLGASIGISLAPDDGIAAEELMRRADIALYRAKKSGRGSFRFFEVEMDMAVKRRAQIERDLRKAIEDGTVRPYYQPIVNLKSGEIIGFEALARWHHPDFGDIEPTQLIGIAEDSGMITRLAAHLLRWAARDATAWPPHIKLCFNISRLQLADPMLVLRVLQILGETGLNPKRLEVEISEDALVSDIAAAKQSLEAFRKAGVRIALDDFGTGNSSLRHLRECHFDRLKIDRTFVGNMAASSENTSVINAVLGLSKALGIAVTAEGIESKDAIAALRDGGCDEGQGFEFSKAVPAEDALRLLNSRRAHLARTSSVQ